MCWFTSGEDLEGGFNGTQHKDMGLCGLILCGTRYDSSFLSSKITFHTGKVGPEITKNVQWNVLHPDLSCKVVDISK